MISAAIIFLPPIVCKYFQWEVDFYSLFWYLSIGVGTMCFCWFRLIRGLSIFQRSTPYTRVLAELSQLSFGIYLVHIFIMRDILWHWSFLASLPVYYQIPVCSVLTLTLSYGVSKLISKLPFSKYIIGC